MGRRWRLLPRSLSSRTCSGWNADGSSQAPLARRTSRGWSLLAAEVPADWPGNTKRRCCNWVLCELHRVGSEIPSQCRQALVIGAGENGFRQQGARDRFPAETNAKIVLVPPISPARIIVTGLLIRRVRGDLTNTLQCFSQRTARTSDVYAHESCTCLPRQNRTVIEINAGLMQQQGVQ